MKKNKRLDSFSDSDLTELPKIFFGKKIAHSGHGAVGAIDFAFFKTPLQFVRLHINDFHSVGMVKYIVRHDFAYSNLRNIANYVVDSPLQGQALM